MEVEDCGAFLRDLEEVDDELLVDGEHGAQESMGSERVETVRDENEEETVSRLTRGLVEA